MDALNINNKKRSQEKQREIIFWYNILYIIGSCFIDNYLDDVRTEQPDALTKLFCGYWLLYTIAIISEKKRS